MSSKKMNSLCLDDRMKIVEYAEKNPTATFQMWYDSGPRQVNGGIL